MISKLRLVGLAAIALCAFGAVSASAQAAIHWNVGGSALGNGANKTFKSAVELTEFELEKNGSTVKEKVAVLTVSGLLRISCTGLNMNGGKITGTAGGSATSLELTGCTVQSGLGANFFCKVKSKTPATMVWGTILTNAVTLTLMEFRSKAYMDIVPTTGATGSLTELEIAASGGFCPVSDTGTAITGTTALEIPLNATDTTKVMGTASMSELHYGARATVLGATAGMELTTGEAWGAHSP